MHTTRQAQIKGAADYNGSEYNLNEHPDGIGHLTRMEQAYDSLVAKYLGGSFDPEVKHKIALVLKEFGARNANRAFDDEQTRLVATATIKLQNAVNQGSIYIANGENPDDAMEAPQPAADMIPDSIPEKQKMIRNAQNYLL